MPSFEKFKKTFELEGDESITITVTSSGIILDAHVFNGEFAGTWGPTWSELHSIAIMEGEGPDES